MLNPGIWAGGFDHTHGGFTLLSLSNQKIIEPGPDSNLEHSVCISLKFESWTLESVCPSDSEIVKRIKNKCGYIKKS